MVLGGADYKRILPPRSYIDVADYNSPRDLADHLKRLDRDDEEYWQYFWWKEWYRVGRGDRGGTRGDHFKHV